jgi:hypothetical protein
MQELPTGEIIKPIAPLAFVGDIGERGRMAVQSEFSPSVFISGFWLGGMAGVGVVESLLSVHLQKGALVPSNDPHYWPVLLAQVTSAFFSRRRFAKCLSVSRMRSSLRSVGRVILSGKRNRFTHMREPCN